ncbi:conserved hypothetical protein [Histoplasma capsulatum var. duboisii H88]|uniref:Uncharacterized protein n=1 Tax=Ajellomyces capsulatus (strain H88) TaxID=544711 RepID=F0UT66_AJEC8|nr:conserved hypothetical protein [Histoplasma capsulatum var. duboisii H88]
MSTNHSSSGQHQDSSPSQQNACLRTRTPSGRLDDDSTSVVSQSGLSSPLSSALSSHAFVSPIPLRQGASQIKDDRTLSQVSQHTNDDSSSGRDVQQNTPSQPRDGEHQLTNTFTTSFNSFSQRVVRDGKVIVTNSDEDTDSLSDLESAEDLLARFLKPPASVRPLSSSSHSPRPGRDNTDAGRPTKLQQLLSGRSSLKLNDRKDLPKYQFSLDTLVADAANDKATEAKVAKIKQGLLPKVQPERCRGVLRADLLAAAVEDETDTKGIQRLKDAVERTETFATRKIWLFFEEKTPVVPYPRFPSGWIQPASWECNLEDPETRGPAFISGIVSNRLSSRMLPDEVLLWLLQTANALFYRILESGYSKPSISIRTLTFNDDTRQHALKITLRLAIDEAVMNDCLICVEVQNFITTNLANPITIPDQTLVNLSLHLFKTINEVELQNQLLNNILPTSPRVALFRCRLAWAWFYCDPSFLDRPKSQLFDLPSLTKYLKHDLRFNTNMRSNGSNDQFNFWELHALTSILDIAIDSGTTIPSFVNENGDVDRGAEHQFNAAIDDLADCIKAIFSAIRDSGASHLRRSETRERLQALYYRLTYGVRTKPRPPKQWFVKTEGEKGETDKHQKKIHEYGVVQDAGNGALGALQH